MSKPSSERLQHFEYLNDLRESGVTNMFGAAPYLQKRFGLDRAEAIAVLSEWMLWFENPNPRSRAQ